MRNPQGYASVIGPPGRLVSQAARAANPGLDALAAHTECDTFTCGHCQHVTLVPPFARPEDMGGFCRQCSTAICKSCHGVGTCTPWEAKMEKQEARSHALKSYGM
jgi:hypothetical protein